MSFVLNIFEFIVCVWLDLCMGVFVIMIGEGQVFLVVLVEIMFEECLMDFWGLVLEFVLVIMVCCVEILKVWVYDKDIVCI